MSRDIRYAKNGDLHLAYNATGPGGGIDVLRLAAFAATFISWHGSAYHDAINARLESLGRLIDLDGRGMGLSDRMIGGTLPTLEDRMDDVRAVLDAAGSSRALLCSFADSGPLACLFAATFPERTLGLVLMNTRPRMAWAHDYPWGMHPDEVRRELKNIEEHWGRRESALDGPLSLSQSEVTRGMSFDEAVDWNVQRERLAAGPGDAAAIFRVFSEWDVRNVLQTIRVPTLVLTRGGEMSAEGQAFASLIPGARHAVMPGAARYVYGDHAEAYLDATATFALEIIEAEAELASLLATVLFTDIVGSTALQAELGDRRWQDLVEQHHRLVRGCLARFRGRELDTAGDGFFATFDGPVRGIRCAQTIVEAVRALGIEVRAGLHTGECRTVDGKPGGLAVSIGSRVTSLAGPSEILVSQTVRDLIAGSGLVLEGRGEHELRGVPGAWRVYAVA
jgi:class 3 adenylate cyclase